MVMTLKDHADVETEGTLSPYQARRAELQYLVALGAAAEGVAYFHVLPSLTRRRPPRRGS